MREQQERLLSDVAFGSGAFGLGRAHRLGPQQVEKGAEIGHKRPPTSPAVQDLFEATCWLQSLRFEIAADTGLSIAKS